MGYHINHMLILRGMKGGHSKAAKVIPLNAKSGHSNRHCTQSYNWGLWPHIQQMLVWYYCISPYSTKKSHSWGILLLWPLGHRQFSGHSVMDSLWTVTDCDPGCSS